MASTSSRVQQCSAAFACLLLSLFTSSASAWPFPEPDPPTPVGGFHFKLSEDILVNATKDAVLKSYTISDTGKNSELFSETRSGLDNFAGIFRPSSGYYFLSTLVHVAVVVQEQEALSQAAENSTNAPAAEEGDKPRVTVSICINGHCGNSAVLRSSSVLPSSGDLHTFSMSGILNLQEGQALTVQVQNHSSRQVLISKLSTFNTYLMKEH